MNESNSDDEIIAAAIAELDKRGPSAQTRDYVQYILNDLYTYKRMKVKDPQYVRLSVLDHYGISDE